MIDWKVVFQVILSLLFVLVFVYFLLPAVLKRRIPYFSKRGSMELEEVLFLGRETFIASVRIKNRRYYVIFSDKFAKILREEDVNTDSSGTN